MTRIIGSHDCVLLHLIRHYNVTEFSSLCPWDDGSKRDGASSTKSSASSLTSSSTWKCHKMTNYVYNPTLSGQKKEQRQKYLSWCSYHGPFFQWVRYYLVTICTQCFLWEISNNLLFLPSHKAPIIVANFDLGLRAGNSYGPVWEVRAQTMCNVVLAHLYCT